LLTNADFLPIGEGPALKRRGARRPREQDCPLGTMPNHVHRIERQVVSFAVVARPSAGGNPFGVFAIVNDDEEPVGWLAFGTSLAPPPGNSNSS